MRIPQHGAGLVIAAVLCATAGCTSAEPHQSTAPSDSATSTSTSPLRLTLSPDPAQLADDLVTDEQTLRDPAATESARSAAAHRQQLAYRAIGRHPEWEVVARPRIPHELLGAYERNVSARRHLNELSPVPDTLPAWNIVPPAPADRLLGYFHEADAQFGVGWNYLAAINLIETGFGRIAATSTAGAQGPMQFLPSTFAAYGDGGDIHSFRDSIMAAGRYLAASGFADNPDRAIYQYNHADEYVQAVNQYAAILAADPIVFDGYHRWNIYYFTTAGDVLLPEGYAETARIPAEIYLQTHPR